MRTALHAEFPKQGKNREVCEILPTPPWTKKCSNYRDLAGQFPTQPNREFFAIEQRTLGTEQGLNPTNQGNVFLASPVYGLDRFLRVSVKREIRPVAFSMVKARPVDGACKMESNIATDIARPVKLARLSLAATTRRPRLICCEPAVDHAGARVQLECDVLRRQAGGVEAPACSMRPR